MTSDELNAIKARNAARTPDKWVIEELSAKDSIDGENAMTGIMCYADEDGKDGAMLAEVNRWSYGDDPPKMESVANAQFIAACSEDVPALIAEVELLQAAIRTHRDQRGDDRCWLDDDTLYAVLPEGYTPPARDACVELADCEKFIATRHNPGTTYVSPQRRIEELETETKQLKALLALAYRAIYLSSNGLARANLKNDIEAVLEE